MLDEADSAARVQRAMACRVSLVDLLTGRITYSRDTSSAAYDTFSLQPRSFIAAGVMSGALATSGARPWH